MNIILMGVLKAMAFETTINSKVNLKTHIPKTRDP
jgi:hypothetical protein